jgi:GNAT superfamily N-acetyltransferase
MLNSMNDFSIRAAALDDVIAIAAVMREAVESFGRDVYTPRQIASALRYICRPDEQLIIDRTYFVAVADELIIGCGGWSRRRKVYSGSASSPNEEELLDPATEPARIRSMFVRPSFGRRGIGRAILQYSEQRAAAEGFRRLRLIAMRSAGTLYELSGYVAISEAPVVLEDGVVLECMLMEKKIESSP